MLIRELCVNGKSAVIGRSGTLFGLDKRWDIDEFLGLGGVGILFSAEVFEVELWLLCAEEVLLLLLLLSTWDVEFSRGDFEDSELSEIEEVEEEFGV